MECYFVNFFSSDSDNLTGSVLDCLVEAEVLANDSSGYVVGCSGEFVKQRKQRNQDKVVGILGVQVSSEQKTRLSLKVKSSVSGTIILPKWKYNVAKVNWQRYTSNI
ncbi:MAG: hypothetical protein DSM106950_46375 [Stigonema ocellatum SAG 48.90 = DSM 106950]|nr:hypothetical protein [Stigonema ocellatum SAG 48.90 = DSM 106950]